jgi:two-component SAPR family response regulator
MDQEHKAANLAETDQPVDAKDVSRETGGIEESKKLVVVGKESFFSEEIIEYAVDMAERMSYEIVALNTAPLSCETFNQSSSRDQICTDFQMLSKLNVQSFREEAQKRGIPFSHVVKYTESSEVLRELRKEIGEFEFVVSQEEQDVVTDSDMDDERFRQGIFVYSIL